ncbi:MAG TPA: Fe-S protein assembly co-chaperone HscB [Burkholderiaceae bacterium]|jgi:molecular chaperone HscB|nr:Fe-S protein assembly co-chaperone HscB [Burkholderiaceae bacterium]
MDAGLSLQATDFELFGLPERFALDLGALDAKWKQLQGAAHPDRFATETAAAQRIAMQWAVRINEAYRRLKNPLARAAYLCALHGVDLEAESNTAMPPAFLMQQMEWRDALSEATTLDAVDALADEVAASREATLKSLQSRIDGAAGVDWRAVAGSVRGLMFVDKFMSDIDRRVDALS